MPVLDELTQVIRTRPFGQLLSTEDMTQACAAYLQGNASERSDFLATLSCYLGTEPSHLATMIHSTDGPSIDGMMRLQTQALTTISNFQHRAHIHELPLESLALSHFEWMKVKKLASEANIIRLHLPVFLELVAQVKQEDFITISAALKRLSPSRNTHSQTPPQRPTKKIRRHLPKEIRPQGEPAILPTPTGLSMQTPVFRRHRTQIQRRPLTESNSPNRSWRSPKGTAYRPYATIRGTTLFKSKTPYKSKLPSKADADRVISQTFKATAISMSMHAESKRRRGQNAIMRGRCKDEFEQAGISIEGACHWSHLVAYFLGGGHHQENIVAATAQANQNMLHAYERRMGYVIRNGETNAVDITANAYYLGENNVPFRIEVELSWPVEGQEAHHEIHYFNPRSQGRLSRAQIEAIEELSSPLSTPPRLT